MHDRGVANTQAVTIEREIGERARAAKLKLRFDKVRVCPIGAPVPTRRSGNASATPDPRC